MATFNYTVDTHPMAQEIGSVSNHLKVTTTAVVAMQTAVVLAEAKAADHVCENVNRGFYSLIRSQISQKAAISQAKVDSHLMQLNQQKKQLLAIKGRMERDYNMISNRYLKLFNGLNSNLKHRVFELDKPTINFAVRDVEKVSNRTKHLTATVPVSQLESLAVSQKIIASNLKYRGMNVISSMTKFLGDMYAQKELTSHILLQSSSKTEIAILSVPVAISESNYDSHDNKNVEIILNDAELTKHAQSAIKNAVMPNVAHLQWKREPEINKEVQSEFSKLLTSSASSERVKDMANKLFIANNYQTIQTQ
jgi:predicted nuclease with TOPRIM domain